MSTSHFPYETGYSINFFTYGIYKIPAIQEKSGGWGVVVSDEKMIYDSWAIFQK